jgi:hypothetical protein
MGRSFDKLRMDGDPSVVRTPVAGRPLTFGRLGTDKLRVIGLVELS